MGMFLIEQEFSLWKEIPEDEGEAAIAPCVALRVSQAIAGLPRGKGPRGLCQLQGEGGPKRKQVRGQMRVTRPLCR